MPLYPEAPRLDLVDDLHGRPVPDPYRWLESGDAGDDVLRAEWSAQQTVLYDAEAATWTTTGHWRTRVGDLLRSGGVGPPAHRGARAFFMRREPDGNMAVLWTIDPDGAERVLIDPMELDPEGHTTLDAFQPSKEGHLLAYQLSVGGTEEPDLFVMDVATGEQVEGPIDRVRFSPIAWLPGAEAYYYVRRLDPSLVPEAERPFHRRIYLHRVGTDPSTDVEVFGAGRTITNYYGVSVSIDGHWLQVSSQEGTEPRNDLWVADLTTSSLETPGLVPVQVDVDAQTGISFGRDGRFYVHTDRDAPMGRLAVVDPSTPTAEQLGHEHWVDLLPEDPAAVLEDFAVLDGPGMAEPRLLATWSRHGVGEMTLHDLATGAKLGDVELPGVGTLGGIVERPEGGPVVWFVYTDYTTPSNVYTYDGRTGAVELYAAPPGHVDVPTVVSRQETYTSKDGTTVRMFVLSPADGADEPRPTLLSGYGGFGIAMQPAYSATSLAWVEAGGVYAVACIRGGGEEGEEWHRDGMLANKQNVFDDFFAAQEHLVATGRTTPEQLAIIGGSNGGLLMGAAVTQRPDLARTVVCQAPLLDMVRYTTSQLGQTWTVEYGDPEVPEQLDWLLSYSPYHNVPEGTDFPALLMMVFDNDSRTDPMHGRKFVAAAQQAAAGSRPIVLRTEANVGHGARSVSKSVDEIAEWLAFVARWTGLEPGAG